jgi:cyclopropane-fatty-acyl-phospholipid synthase
MTGAPGLREVGTSRSAIEHHYDISDDFFRIWLGADLVYSCALWDEATDLADAQRHKLDWFAGRLGVHGARVLDVGCGWGALLDRFRTDHAIAKGVGLTLSPAQMRCATGRGVPDVEYRLESWVDHRPAGEYDVVTAIESTEHFASGTADADEKVEIYRAFFDNAAEWLSPDGRVGLQLICLDGVGHEQSRLGVGPIADNIGVDIFPESMASSLSEMVLGWETHFRLVDFLDHTDHYVRTFRAWARAFRARRTRVEELIGPDRARTFDGYFAASEVLFRMRRHALYRVILHKRERPKRWVMPLRPSMLGTTSASTGGASAAAIEAHYDLSDDFYATWLGPSMIYTSGLWGDDDDPADLESALERKVDFFAGQVLQGDGRRLLDIGCGWGGVLRRLVDEHGVDDAVGLTLSAAQTEFSRANPVNRTDVLLTGWESYRPGESFDAIVSFGAFEHFARADMNGPQRVARYREFFVRCYEWLRPNGRMALETITHDGAPDSAGPGSRGPLSDAVLDLYPESLCPHLSEVVLGFEPWFEVLVMRSDADDFARTLRHWQLRLRANEGAAVAAVGAATVRMFRRYLAASEIQFRDATLTNLRLVLRRRAEVKR